MKIHVFVGPTLSHSAVEQELPGAIISAPVAFGDVYRAVKSRAQAIAIIDGYFERTPAVWHKEILWAMSEGVHVFGASSMGALRAAELADFGMQGVGAIFNCFRNGELEDDDEVTVVHGSADDGFKLHSEAMVNLRTSFLAAAATNVVSPATTEALIELAKRRFYAERSFERTLKDAADSNLPPEEIAALRLWWPTGRIDQKALDALLLLRNLHLWREGNPQPQRVSYRLEPTDAWLEACRVAELGATSTPVATEHSMLEEELKLTGSYIAVRDAAIARAATHEEARRSGFRPDPASVAQAAESLRRDLGLFEPADYSRWQRSERLEATRLPAFFEEHACVLWAQPQTLLWAKEALANQLRVTQQYGRLIERVDAKVRCLANFGLRGPSLGDLHMTEDELWSWFFKEKLGEKEVPEHLDRRAVSLGFLDKDEMRSAALREFTFLKVGPRAPTDG
ncbi:MAG: TfuA-like protein [Pseudomonadota bacterium]